MQRLRERPETHRKWRCPKCGKKFENPIGLTAVWCPEQYHKNASGTTSKDPVAMKPDEEASA